MATILHIGGGPGQDALVRRLLEDDGHGVVTAPDLRAGLKIALAEHPDLILLDVDTPGADGYETATRLRGVEALEGVPIVTLSARGDRELALALGCEGCIEKPLEPSRFARRVRAFLKGKRERVRAAAQRRSLQAYSRSLVEKLEHKVVELSVANRRLRHADELKNRVFENVSHELATPLTPILGYLTLLESGRLGPLAPRQRKALAGVSRTVRRLSRTVDQLLDLAALQDAEMPVALGEVDAVQLARDARQTVEAEARSRRIHLEVHLPPDVVRLRADEARLRQAVVRLLDHAIRYSPRGGYVLLEVARDEGRVRFSVYDSGQAVPAKAQDQVFEPFAAPGRATDTPPRPDLGLALARRIAEAHGGGTSVESPPRAHPDSEHDYPGAKLTLTIPASAAR